MEQRYFWDNKKNETLKKTRGISFEEIVSGIAAGDLLDDTEHPNKILYPHQSIYVVVVREYAYLVPYHRLGEGIFLVTIIPSRKAKRDYMEE